MYNKPSNTSHFVVFDGLLYINIPTYICQIHRVCMIYDVMKNLYISRV